MNISEYIESGILDLYVLGGLSEEEVAEVESFAAQFPEINKEIEAIRSAFEKLPRAATREPSVSVKKSIFEKIDSLHTGQEKHSAYVPKKQDYTRFYLAIAASWLLTVFSLCLTYYFHNKWKQSQTELAEVKSQNQEIASDFNLTKQNIEKLHGQISALSETDLQLITLKPVAGKPESYAQVFWSRKTGKLLINSSLLPQVPLGKQYQLWAIVNGKPVDAGLVPQTGGPELIRMKNTDNAMAFAVTLEKEGGNTEPTLSEMYVMGSI